MNTVLEFTLALLVIFLFLSLIVSGLGEAISGWLSLRFKTLKTGITALLQNDTSRVNDLFNHPLITALGQAGVSKPSYIPTATFSKAVLDNVCKAARESSDAAKIVECIKALPEGSLKQALLVLAADGKNSREEMEKKLGDYFDSTMERVSGWYKRRMQVVLFLVGFVVCALLNADLFMITSLLHRDATTRQELAAVGTSLAASTNVPALTNLTQRLDKISLPLGWSNNHATDVQAGTKQGTEVEDLRAFPWSGEGCLAGLQKLLGLALCALATSFGAPFWFDLLDKVVRLRGSVDVTQLFQAT